MKSKTKSIRKRTSKVALAPLDFESVVRAAMSTGKPPKAKPKKAKAKRRVGK